MKLTAEGRSILSLHQARGFSLGSFSFKPEQFTNCLVFSVEEAQVLKSLLDDLYHTTEDMQVEKLAFDYGRVIRNRLNQGESQCD